MYFILKDTYCVNLRIKLGLNNDVMNVETFRQYSAAIDTMEKQHEETGVCRHHGDRIEGIPETLGISQHYRIEVFKGGPSLGPHYAERRKTLRQRMHFFPIWFVCHLI